MKIETAAVIGMGALGLLFGSRIAEHIGNENLLFLMEEERFLRHEKDVFRINGEEKHFTMVNTERDIPKPVDLMIIATKYGGLRDAMRIMKPYVNDNTVIITLLNGIISEDLVAEVYARERIIDCVPIGMDAMREGSEIHYTKPGKLQIGIREEGQKESFDALCTFFDRTGVPYEAVTDIAHAMWNKFMINVGINQTCMIYEGTYHDVMADPKSRQDLSDAMHEVINLAGAEGVSLTEEDLQKDLEILNGLNPKGYPSMRQDAVAKRRTEVELFAGTMIRIAEKHGMDVPVNRRFYETILEMEKDFL